MFYRVTVVTSGFTALQLLSYHFYSSQSGFYICFFSQFLIALLHWLVWVVRIRFQYSITRTIALLFVVLQRIHVHAARHLTENVGQGDLSLMVSKLFGYFFIYSILLTPSTSVLYYCYCPCFFICFVEILAIQSETEET